MTSLTLLPSNAVEVSGARTFTTSLMVAETFGKLHKNVLQSIDEIDCSAEFRGLNFQPTFRGIPGPNGSVRQERAFEMTKNGFTFLVMGYTGAKAAQFKEAYIARFDEMEAALQHPQARLDAARFILSVVNGKMQLTEIANDQHLVSGKEWIDFVRHPGFPQALLPDVLNAVSERMKHGENAAPWAEWKGAIARDYLSEVRAFIREKGTTTGRCLSRNFREINKKERDNLIGSLLASKQIEVTATTPQNGGPKTVQIAWVGGK